MSASKTDLSRKSENLKFDNQLLIDKLKVMKNQIESLQSITAKHEEQLSELDEQLNHTKLPKAELEGIISGDKQKEYQERLEEFKKGPINKETFVKLKSYILREYNEQDCLISDLTVNNEQIKQINANLHEKLNEYQKEFDKEKFCVNCHKVFSLKDNVNVSCVYHSGRLKYFSCK